MKGTDGMEVYKMNKFILWVAFLFLSLLTYTAPLKIGVTLQPYYSFTANIVGDKAEVVPVIRADLHDIHSYQPTYEDIKNLAQCDAVIINGIGHDEFIFSMIKVIPENSKLKVINANEGISLMPVGGTRHSEKILNPHTFISITTTIQQVYTIAKELGKIDPENKDFYMKNAKEYAKKLRKLKYERVEKIAKYSTGNIKVATMHGGYDYLLSEFGIDVKAVIEPAHGIQPTASDLKEIIDIIKKEKIDIIFAERAYTSKYVETIQKETGVEIGYLSHLTEGEYSKESFEKFIVEDLNSVADVLIKISKNKKGK